MKKSQFNTHILCTLGPSSLVEGVIRGMEDRGVRLFRINLSHTPLDELESTIDFVQKISRVPICLDTEGAQMRTGLLPSQGIALKQNSKVTLSSKGSSKKGLDLIFYPSEATRQLRHQTRLNINHDAVFAEVNRKGPQELSLKILKGGHIHRNKAVAIYPAIKLPPLTHKDRKAIRMGMKMGIRHIALSFANHPDNVDLVRSLCRQNTTIISKLETRQGVRNMYEISRRSDALIIDRGDLSREEPLQAIDQMQKHIIQCGKKNQREVFVATYLLDSMISEDGPTHAEKKDIQQALRDGTDGFVLAAETAIGKDPLGCVDQLRRFVSEFQNEKVTANAV